jgi:hypothetical protein
MATNLFHELRDAARANDVDKIKTVLRSARAAKKFDWSLVEYGLGQSAWFGSEDAVAHLLRESAGFLVPGGSMFDPPFLKAVRANEVAIAAMLPEAGANPNAVEDGDGWSALHVACHNGSLEMVNLLLGAKAELNLRIRDGSTPLVFAVKVGAKDVVGALVKQRGLAMRDIAGDQLFWRAVARSNPWDIAELLAPHNCAEALTLDAVSACKQFWTITADWDPAVEKYVISQIESVYDLLYGPMPLLPSINSGRFRWIHFPANNLAWIEATVIKWYEDTQSLIGLLSSLAHCHQGQYPHSRFRQPSCQVHEKHIWISIPYLSYETALSLQRLQDTIQLVVDSTASDTQLESLCTDDLLVKAYMALGGEGLHIRRTLDQYFYPNFGTRVRDRDQVVYRSQKSTGIRSDDPKL